MVVSGENDPPETVTASVVIVRYVSGCATRLEERHFGSGHFHQSYLGEVSTFLRKPANRVSYASDRPSIHGSGLGCYRALTGGLELPAFIDS